jgi:hypothetical protein
MSNEPTFGQKKHAAVDGAENGFRSTDTKQALSDAPRESPRLVISRKYEGIAEIPGVAGGDVAWSS